MAPEVVEIRPGIITTIFIVFGIGSPFLIHVAFAAYTQWGAVGYFGASIPGAISLAIISGHLSQEDA